MSESSEVEGGGTTTTAAVAGSTDASVEVSPVEEGGGGTTPKDSTSKAFRSCSQLSNPLLKKDCTYRSDNMNMLRRRKLI